MKDKGLRKDVEDLAELFNRYATVNNQKLRDVLARFKGIDAEINERVEHSLVALDLIGKTIERVVALENRLTVRKKSPAKAKKEKK